MSEDAGTNIVEKWLALEASNAPQNPVIAILKSATKSMVLDEGAVLNELRKLCEDISIPSDKANVSR